MLTVGDRVGGSADISLRHRIVSSPDEAIRALVCRDLLCFHAGTAISRTGNPAENSRATDVNNVAASEIYCSVACQTYIDSGDSQVHVQVGVY